MDEKLDFSLPEKKQTSSLSHNLIILLLLVIIGLILVNIFFLSEKKYLSENSASSLPEDKVKELVSKLASRNLYRQAAKVWQEYLSLADISDTQRAKAMYQTGMLLEKAGKYDEALEYYYRSEMTAKLPELEQTLNVHIKDCYEHLGNFSALRYEMMDKTTLNQANVSGSRIVAEIGPEKITASDLDALIERSFDLQLAPMAAFMTTDQLHEQKKKFLESYRDPFAKQEFLQSWLAQEVLYRQALNEGLSEQPETKAVIDDLVRSALSQQLMSNEIADKINLTETDLQTFYQANQARYTEPAKARISHILVSELKEAKDILDRINDGEAFAGLAKTFSMDADTQEDGGDVDFDVLKGTFIPAIGDYEALNKQIFDTEPGEVLEKPFETDKGWEIVKVREKTAETQQSFDEVRQQVANELLRQKRQDVQADLIKRLMDKYDIILHTSVFIDTEPDDTGQANATSSK